MHASKCWSECLLAFVILTPQGWIAAGSESKEDLARAELERLRVIMRADDEHGETRADAAYSAIEDADLPLFQQIPDLRILDLHGTAVSDAGMEHLGKLATLRELNLDHTQIVGHGLKHLKDLRSLVGLYLAYTNVSDADIVYLAGLPNLKRLNLCNTRVTDKVLPVLVPMTNLQYVGAMCTGVTEAAAKRHEKATSIRLYAGHERRLFADAEVELPGHTRWTVEFERASQVALKRLDADVEAAPEAPVVLVRRSRHHEHMESIEKAMADANRAVDVDSRCVEALLQRAELFRYQGIDDKAIEDLNSAVELAPSDARLYLARANVQADLTLSLKDFEKSIQLTPNNATAWIDRGLTWAGEGNMEETRKNLDEAIRLSPLNTKALRNRAFANRALGDHTRAKVDLGEAVRIDPTYVNALNELAELLATCPDASLRDGKRAVFLAIDACQLTDSKDSYCLDTLAAAFAETGDFTRAVGSQQEAIDLGRRTNQLRPERAEWLDLYNKNKPRRASPTAN